MRTQSLTGRLTTGLVTLAAVMSIAPTAVADGRWIAQQSDDRPAVSTNDGNREQGSAGHAARNGDHGAVRPANSNTTQTPARPAAVRSEPSSFNPRAASNPRYVTPRPAVQTAGYSDRQPVVRSTQNVAAQPATRSTRYVAPQPTASSLHFVAAQPAVRDVQHDYVRTAVPGTRLADGRPPVRYVRDDQHGVRPQYTPDRYHHVDSGWSHGRVYPNRGRFINVLPRQVMPVRFHNRPYWYGGGVWYAPYGPRFVVVAPPLGVYVNMLPPYYTTVWFGGIPYYYANDTYYAWREPQRAYEVVEPPADETGTTESPAAEDIYVYPREGQDEQQTAKDRYECHRWAADQTGFDPTLPEGGVPADQVSSLREAYLRAMTACLEGRGYSVR